MSDSSNFAFLVQLLLFFSRSADEQIAELELYKGLLDERGSGPHGEPLIKLAQNLSGFRELGEWVFDDCSPAHDLPHEAVALIEELAALLFYMVEHEIHFTTITDTYRSANIERECLFDLNRLRDEATWRLVRRLSTDALRFFDGAQSLPRLSLWDLLCHLGE